MVEFKDRGCVEGCVCFVRSKYNIKLHTWFTELNDYRSQTCLCNLDLTAATVTYLYGKFCRYILEAFYFSVCTTRNIVATVIQFFTGS